jgi:hypothetical protein
MFVAVFWAMPVFQTVIVVGIFVLSLHLLNDLLKPDSERGIQGRRLRLFLAIFFGWSYVGANVLWYAFAGHLHSRIAVVGLYVAIRLLGGAWVAMLIPVALPSSAKALLPISAVVCLAFNVLAFWFETRYRVRLLLSADGIGLFLGALLSWVLSRTEPSKGSNTNAEG